MLQLPHKIAVVLFVLFLAHFAYYYPSLPEYIASNFRGDGQPQAWMSRSTFILFESGLLLIIAFMMFGLPRLIKNIPPTLVNMPNRHYWLAPERQEKTRAILHREMGWILVGMITFFIAVNHLVFEANLAEPQRLSGWFMVVFIAFLLFVVIWGIRFLIIFRKPK
ncbi:MAG: DUF1648 domain-containing protein [Pyrinomonadaceae bacterium]|nr:DUF1648 domain-containing protein [Pyrinomonadaceae bacterium]